MRGRNVPLMTKINLVFFVVIVLACGLLSALSYQLNLQSHLSEQENKNTMLLRAMTQSIDARLAQAEIITQEMAYDEEVISLLRGKSLPKQILSISFSVGEKLFRNETYLSALATDMVVLSVDDTMVESYDTLVHEDRLSENPFYSEFLNTPQLAAWGVPEVSTLFSGGDWVLPYYHKVITGLNTRIGSVRCAVRVDRLFAPLAGYGDGALMVIRGDDRLYSAGGEADMPSHPRTGSWREGGNLYYAMSLGSMEALLVLQTPYARIRNMAMRDIAFSILAICTLGGLLLLTTRGVVKAILSRLHRLTEAVSSIPTGDYSMTLPEAGPDEVGRLSRAFSSLLRQVNAYYDELLQQEKDKRHAQTMALQYQLNPHFLFNSLYWLQLQMEEHNADPALTASIEHLGQVLHYNMLGSRLALLSEEREHILAYVGFMSAMKEDSIRLTVDMPDSLSDAKILRFTLQPLLENAIRHGYVSGRGLSIHIAFRADAARDLFEIAVRNDGRSIPADQLAELQERLDAAALEGLPMANPQTGHGTALNNLARRLALTYGGAAGLHVESRDGDTCVRVLLPLSECVQGGIDR